MSDPKPLPASSPHFYKQQTKREKWSVLPPTDRINIP